MIKNKKLRKGAFFTDIHFGKKSNSPVHNQDCLNYVSWFCEQTIKNKCDYVSFMGDWNENRSALNIQTMNYAHEAAKKLNDLGIPIYFIIGNHDLYYRNSRDVHSVIHHGEFEHFQLIDTPTVIDDIEGGVFFCPYLFHEEYPSLTKYLKVPVWAGHFEFKGFVITGYNVRMPTGPDANDFGGPKHIFSGHFHKRQTSKNVTYIGNAFPMDFGDANDTKRGMMIYNHISNKKQFIDWKDCPKYIRTKLSVLVDDPKNVLLPESNVHCIVDIPMDYSETKTLRKQLLKKHKLRELILEESPELKAALQDSEEVIDFSDEKLQTVDTMVLEMLKNIKTDHIDNKILVKEYNKLKLEG